MIEALAMGMTAREYLMGHHLKYQHVRGLTDDMMYNARRISTGARGLARMTKQARYREAQNHDNATITGSALYHSVGDRADAIKQLGIDFAAFQNDMAREIGLLWTAENPESAHDPGKIAWWRHNVVPVLNDWQKFQADELGSWWARFGTSWDSIEAWHDRLKALRTAADSAGFGLSSPEPSRLPTTVWDTAKNAAADIWGMIKMLIYIGIIAIGSFALWQVFKSVKGI